MRCGTCYWALYDGDWCQNPDCKHHGKSVGNNRVSSKIGKARIAITREFIRIKPDHLPGAVFVDAKAHGIQSVEDFINSKHPIFVDFLDQVTVPILGRWTILGHLDECLIEFTKKQLSTVPKNPP